MTNLWGYIEEIVGLKEKWRNQEEAELCQMELDLNKP